ncbi:hypothetical protein BT93_H2702 [Corymbia citriodora subsp. variegata]|nr:hypothetical protein BT93_H2702 [Corymbia citriodora subsp. variegata]
MEKGLDRLKLVSEMDNVRGRSRSRAPGSRNPSQIRAIKGKNPAPFSADGSSNHGVRVEPAPSGFMKLGQPLNQSHVVTNKGQDSRPQHEGNPPLGTRSWANVARAAMQGYSLSFFPPQAEGENIVHCTEEDLDGADPMWHQCLVGYFVGKRLPFRLVESALKHLWGQRLLEVKANDQGFYFFHIADSEFRREVLEGGPLTVARVPLILQQWQPMLELKKGEHSSIPVWIRLKNIPYGLWSATGLSKIASAIGRPLYVDQRTEQLKMISFARVCVELSASSPCHDTVKVLINDATRIIDVEYEWKPVSCPSCGIFGHKCTETISKASGSAPLHRYNELTSLPSIRTSSSSLPAPSAVPLPGSCLGVEDSSQNGRTAEDEGWQTVNRRQQQPTTAVSSLHADGPTVPSFHPAASPTRQNIQELKQTSSLQNHLGNAQPVSSSIQLLVSSIQQPCSNLQQVCSNHIASPPQSPLQLAAIRPSPSRPSATSMKILLDRVASPANQIDAGLEPSSPKSFSFADDLDEKPTALEDQTLLRPQVDPPPEYDTPALQLTEVRVEQVATPPIQTKSTKQASGSQPLSGTLATKKTAARGRRPKRRRPLWNSLVDLSLTLKDSPWMVAGDFNAIKDPSDRVGSPDIWIPAFDEFKECLDQAELVDLRYVGFRFTWSTSSGTRRKQRKIDRVLVNNHWCMAFSFSEASFLAPGISDHSPMVVRIHAPTTCRIPFKFFNFWLTHPDFLMLVDQAWETQVTWSPMFTLYTRLKVLKARLKTLNKEHYSDITMRVTAAKRALVHTQEALHQDPGSSALADIENSQLKA